MTPATPADRPQIEAFLQAHIATSMFPLSNLARHGMAGGHPRALSFWITRSGGAISDVLTISDEGMVFPQCPSGCWGEVAVVLAGTAIRGILGHAGQVAALRRFLDVPDDAATIDTVEPMYTLTLTDLIIPVHAGLALRPLDAVPRETLLTWRAAYGVETLAIPGVDVQEQAVRDIANYIAADSHRALFDGDTPVAMTGFNAVMPQTVQIGGVYTPPALRSRGYARIAVALHLAQARAQGVRAAVLFAANAPAERAYRAIGFQQSGQFAVAIYNTPQVVYG